MTPKDPNREAYFPAIEKKYGQPMSYWHAAMKDMKGAKYPEMIAYLKEEHGFTQAHANALVMYSRGSKSSKKFETVEDYLDQFDDVKVKTVNKIFKAVTSKYPKLELVIAWNQPMLRLDGQYILGVTVLTNHILLAPWSKDILEKFSKRLAEYEVNKKTIKVAVDWKVDAELLQDMARARMAELK